MPSYSAEHCQHTKLNGDRCQSPALRDQKLCYFHSRCSPVQIDITTSAQFPPCPFFLPVLEDAASVQWGIAQVCEHLLNRRLDAKKAGLLLYALQIASANLARLQDNKTKNERTKKDDAETEGQKAQKNQETTKEANQAPEETTEETTEENNPANWREAL